MCCAEHEMRLRKWRVWSSYPCMELSGHLLRLVTHRTIFCGINFNVLSFMKDRDFTLSGHPAVCMSVDLFHFRKGLTVSFNDISPNICLRRVFHIFYFSPRFFILQTYTISGSGVRGSLKSCFGSLSTLRSQELCRVYTYSVASHWDSTSMLLE
jgi:hypothetical protein